MSRAPTTALLDLLQIDEGDLIANRAGSVGVRQRRNRRRRTLVLAGVCFALGASFIAGGAATFESGGRWLVPDLVGLAFLVLGAVSLSRARVTRAQHVRRLTGPVELVSAHVGRGGAVLRLIVAGERCIIRQPVRSPRRRWEEALTATSYDVYVVGVVPTVIGMEPAQA